MIIKQCRLCNSSSLKEVIDLGDHPPADTFIPQKYKDVDLPKYPLSLTKCSDCGHVFTSFYVSPEERYQRYEYSYDSSNSIVSENHFKDFAEDVINTKDFLTNSLFVDIGSNVGTLLTKFKDKGFKNVLGIEPSENISKLANSNDIRTLNYFFDKTIYNNLDFNNKADCILSANVFNHTDDLSEVFELVFDLLSDEGILVFEVPYLLDLIKQRAFDTIYHEHVHYFSVKALKEILNSYDFEIVKLKNIDYMCGSLRVFCQKKSSSITEASEVEIFIENEDSFSLFDDETYLSFMTDIKNMKIKLNSDIDSILEKGGKIIGVGAATKGNTLLNFCNLDNNKISYLTDTSQLKVGKYSPGSLIPIKHDDEIDNSVTHLLILPWNLSDYLVNKLSFMKKKFLIPQMENLK